MSTRFALFGQLLLLLLLSGLVTSAAHATTVRQMNLEELASQSHAIVRGRVVDIHSEFIGKRIYTLITLEVSNSYKGALDGTVTISQLGGKVGKVAMQVSGMPLFRQGEEVVVFLWTNQKGKHLVYGLSQGKFSVQRDAQSGKEYLLGVPKGVVQVNKKGTPSDVRVAQPQRIPMDLFVKRLNSMLNK